MCATASFATYFRSTFVEQDGFVGTFDSVVTQEALVERVVESFNNDFEAMSDQAMSDGRINVDLIDYDALGIPTLDDDGDEIEADVLLDQLRSLQRSAVRDAVDDAVNRPDFPEAFTSALVDAHQDFTASLDLDLEDREPLESDGEIFLSLEGTYNRIIRTLEADPATADVAAVIGVEEPGTLKIGDRTTTANRLWGFGRYSRDNAALLVAASVLSLVLSVAVAERRPRALVSAGLGVMFVAAIILVVMYGLWMIVPLLTEGRTSGSLVATVYEHSLRPLLRLEIGVALVGLAVAAVGWLTRWIWPDDWVYSYYDDGGGIKSVARRATRAERLGRQPQGPVPVHAAPSAQPPAGWPQPAPGYPQPHPQAGYPALPYPQQGWAAPAAGWTPTPQQPGWQQQPQPQGWPYVSPGESLPPGAPAPGPERDHSIPASVPDWDPTETREWKPERDGRWDTDDSHPAPPALPAASSSASDWSDQDGWSEPLFGEAEEVSDPASAPTIAVPSVPDDVELSDEPASSWDYGSADW